MNYELFSTFAHKLLFFMEKNNELSVYRSRSLQAVISCGFRLYARNFTKLLRSSWIQAIIYALILGGSMAYFFNSVLPELYGSRQLLPGVAVWAGSVVVFAFAAIIFAFAGGFAPLREHALTDSISNPRKWWGRWPWKLTLHGLATLPLMLLKAIKKKQLGALVTVGLLMTLLMLVSSVIFQLPALILTIANVEAQQGLAAGDAVDMPENLWLINFATFAVCGLLQAYIHLATLFPLYYIWGNTNPKHHEA